jgi:hypothetical protein
MATSTKEELVAEFHSVRHKKQLGVLLLTSLRVAWAPGDIVQAFQVDYPYHQIKGVPELLKSPSHCNDVCVAF